jgi:ferredoxin
MRVHVDFDKCCGNGMCGALAPDYFELDATGELHLLREEDRPEDADVLQQAILCCPTEAISLEA